MKKETILMKKVLGILLVITMTLSLVVGCSKKEDESASGDTKEDKLKIGVI